MADQMTDDEKRKFTRIPFQTQIRVTCGDRTLVSHGLKNIGLGGAFVELQDVIPPGSPCLLEIDLIGAASLLRIQVEGDVVRCEDDGIAIKFTRIDLDSLIHLRHLIKVHAEDPSVINDEYERHLLEVTVTPPRSE